MLAEAAQSKTARVPDACTLCKATRSKYEAFGCSDSDCPMNAANPKPERCGVSFAHPAHDYCDGKPSNDKSGELMALLNDILSNATIGEPEWSGIERRIRDVQRQSALSATVSGDKQQRSCPRRNSCEPLLMGSLRCEDCPTKHYEALRLARTIVSITCASPTERKLANALIAEKLGHDDAHRQLDALHKTCERYEDQAFAPSATPTVDTALLTEAEDCAVTDCEEQPEYAHGLIKRLTEALQRQPSATVSGDKRQPSSDRDALYNLLCDIVAGDDMNSGAEPSVSYLDRAIDNARQFLAGAQPSASKSIVDVHGAIYERISLAIIALARHSR